jgi:HlyD family secretion protein
MFGSVRTLDQFAHSLENPTVAATSESNRVEGAERQEAAVSAKGDGNQTDPATPSATPTLAVDPVAAPVQNPPAPAAAIAADPGSPPPAPVGAATQTAPAPPIRSFIDRYKLLFIVGLLILVAIAVGFGLGRLGKHSDKNENRLVLYGNVDLRQVDLAFNNSERIAEVLVEEGAKVTRGQVLARLDTSRLEPQTAMAEAAVQAQQAVVDKLHHGNRPQEIAQSYATVAAAKADQVNAQQQWARLTALTTLTTGRAISEQDLESAKAALDSAQAHLVVAEKGLDLSKIGPRKEDIAQGEAQLRADQSQLELLRRQLADSELAAPCDAVVRSRLLEPGEMASPQRPVLNLAITDPKWVRAYISEPDLGKIHPGMRASISTDSFPGRALSGWVGFIASVAEFTPKSVQTEELRSSLVYEIRVFVQDSQDEMRLGMPATVLLELDPGARSKP